MQRSKTYTARPAEQASQWYLFDAADRVLGRVATQAARFLMGKHRVTYTPNLSGEDFVVVVNAAKVKVTGKKETQKFYFRHSGYPRGDRLTSLRRMRDEHPERIIEFAISGMLPKNRLRQKRLSRLKVFPGTTHPYSGQKLVEVTL